MSAVDHLFTSLRAAGRKALMPFITAGDPDLEFTVDLIRALSDRGCDMIEIGIPYSDPIADGPVIQASYTRALRQQVRLAGIFDSLSRVASQRATVAPMVPLVAMCSFAIIHRVGAESFVERAIAAGLAGAIVPDLLVEEADGLAAICRRRDFSLIQLVTPTTPRERALRIAELSTGFLYYVSVTGITGERQSLPPELVENVHWLRERTTLPICIGFGISTPEHVRLLAPVADGLIVGSAIVRRVAEVGPRSRPEVLEEIGRFVGDLRAALDST